MTLNCKNMNINVEENMTTSVGQNQNNTMGMNQNNSVGMNISEIAGMNIWQNAVLDYSLIAANITEIAQGERKSRAKEIKENAQNKEVSVQENNDWHSQKEFNNNSGEKSKSS